MKSIHHTIFGTAVALTLLGGCTADEPMPVPGQDAVRISITDAGYPATRATEEGLTTVFTAGDRVGLYAVDADGQPVQAFENVCLTAQGTDSISWSLPAGISLPETEGVRFFCYYPYMETLPAPPDYKAATAADFFSAISAGWGTKEDQSSYADYTASDLMTADAVVSGGNLDFAMYHRMTLVRVILPSTRYVFTNTPAIPDYVQSGPTGVEFTGFKPWESSPGTYAYIVNTARETADLSGRYSMDGRPHSWHFTVPAIPGTANTVTVDRDKARIISHLLQVGDYFLADGSLLSKEAAKTDVEKADVAGIVYNIDPSRIGQAEKDALGGTAHASVLHVRNVKASFDTFSWGPKEDETTIGLAAIKGTTSAESFALADAEISGYGIMQKIKAGRSDYNDKYEAFYYTENFDADRSGYAQLKNVTTGWYLPAAGQWFDIIRNLGNQPVDSNPEHGFIATQESDLMYWKNLGDMVTNINSFMTNVNTNQKVEFKAPTDWYWCASQSDTDNGYCLQLSNSGQGVNSISFFGNPKTGWKYVRCVLTF